MTKNLKDPASRAAWTYGQPMITQQQAIEALLDFMRDIKRPRMSKEEHQKLKDNARIPKEVMMSDLARDEYNHIGHTEYMKKYRKEQ